MNKKLQLVKYRCANCDVEFKAPALPPGAYGEFLLRSERRGALAYVEATSDPVYEEVDRIVKAHPRLLQKNPTAAASILWAVFGIACDPDVDGSSFVVNRMPTCPVCNVDRPSYWEFTEPPEIVDVNVVPVTHARWERLTADERLRLIHDAIDAMDP